MCQKRLCIMKMVVAEFLLRVCSRSFSTIYYVDDGQSPQDVYGACREVGYVVWSF